MLNINIGSRLIASFALAFLFIAFVGWLGIRLAGQMNQTIESPMAAEHQASRLIARMREQALGHWVRALPQLPGSEQQARPAVHGRLWQDIAVSQTQLEAHLAQDRAALALLAPLAQAGASYDAALATSPVAAQGARDRLLQHIDALQAANEQHIAQARGASSAAFRNGRDLILGMLAMAAMCGLVIGYFFIRSITVPLTRAVELTRRVAGGDLTARIEAGPGDETGQLLRSLKEMNDNLARTVGQVRSSSDTVSAVSRDIAARNLDLSRRTEAQAGSLERTSCSMEQLTGAVRQNAEHARQANLLAQSAAQVALDGAAEVSEVVQTMSAINASARKIADIIGVIDAIAFQTNILALNAAVEAARAGEQGRGFAVVAAEVRTLAQRSAGAARQIKDLIGDSVEKVEAGSRLVGQAGNTMGKVLESVRRVTDIMADISSASQAQSAGIEQVNRAIVEMDKVTEQNSALVEQAAGAARAMQDQAGKLAQVVSIFKVDASMFPAPLGASLRTRMEIPARAKMSSRVSDG
ncbi:MAG: methyl-accepting chemotaxis protein [Telluria sp.]|nr:methyl-accepting chemotaxis protein [Telluria sp.]